MSEERQVIRPAAIKKTLHVRAAQQRAFDVFVSQMGSWWLPGHSVLQVERRALVIEPEVGGRWYEVGIDGSEYQWGRVLAWEPPHGIALAWQLNAQFAYDPELETVVDVRFVDKGEMTVVEFEHRHLDRFGSGTESIVEGMDSGWGQLLASFQRDAEQGS